MSGATSDSSDEPASTARASSGEALASSAYADSPTIATRRAQTFPTLTDDEVAHARRFGTKKHYANGEMVSEEGKPSPGLVVVLSGKIRVVGHDAHGHDFTVVEHGPHGFGGELASLSNGRALVNSIAAGDTEALLIDADRLHALLVAEADLGEKIMRSLILRRVALFETGTGGPVLIGSPSSGDVARLRNFLTRNVIPHQLLDPAEDADARAFIERYAPRAADLPLAICSDGSVLRNPSEDALAKCIGMLDTNICEHMYDVAIAGAGPAGLAAAVYAASEGLSVIVIDARAFGGQAGASARIENYLGFPTGISGQALAGRAFTQAQKFGAQMLIPQSITRLDCARYRRPDCSHLVEMEGRGAWYWASPIEGKMCSGQEVVLVGGGNSAGQAAVFLSKHAAKVWMLVRGVGLAASMSKYLIDRIEGIGNIELRTRTEITGVEGSREGGIQSVTWTNRDTGASETRPIRNVFLFLGADPCTDWLEDCGVGVDDRGFVTTGVPTESGKARQPLETSVSGVFAIGDVRAGSVKRVGGAIGEGAAAVAQIHAYLAQHETAARGDRAR